MVNLLGKLDDIKNRAKKIGVEQRMFFTYFFRELFNPNSDSYLDMNSAIESGFNKYISLIWFQNMLVDYNSESRIFFVVTDSYETVNVPYLLLDRDKKGDVFNENPDSYGYKIFYKRNYKENDIFQVIESDLDKRIGWIFPISSIVSTSHDYADNPHYCRYALVAHMLLLRNEIAEQDIVSRDFSSIIESEYSDDAIILIYKKDLVQDNTSVKIYRAKS